MVGKSANREREIQGMQMIETFHGAQVHAVTVGDNVTMVEWEFRMKNIFPEPAIWGERKSKGGKQVDGQGWYLP